MNSILEHYCILFFHVRRLVCFPGCEYGMRTGKFQKLLYIVIIGAAGYTALPVSIYDFSAKHPDRWLTSTSDLLETNSNC